MIRKIDDNDNNLDKIEEKKKGAGNLVIVMEKQPDEPAYRTKRILSQQDVMDWINKRKKWTDFPEYQEE